MPKTKTSDLRVNPKDVTSPDYIAAFQTADVAREFENVMIRCFGQPTATFLRTLDGIHLASAMLASETEIVATDKRLRDAALLLGLKVFP